MWNRSMVVTGLVTLLMFFLTLGTAQSITFLTPSWGVPPDEEALKAFEAESGITVEIQSVQTADLFSRVQISAASGQAAADVIFLTEEAPSNIVATGNMMPLDDLIAASSLDVDDFNQFDFWNIDGDTYGVPVYMQLVMMDYNSARLAEAGFDSPPSTWAELTEQARALQAQGIDDHPIVMKASDWSWYLMALSMGDPMFDEDLNPVFADDGSKAREAMALLLSYFEDELISPEMLTGSITQHALFWSGAGTFHQGWQGSIDYGNNPELSIQAPNVDYLVLPEVGNTWSFPAAIGIAEGSKNPEAAWKFIEWYVSTNTQAAIYDSYGLYPSRSSTIAMLNAENLINGNDAIAEQSMKVNELPRYTLWWGPFTDVVSEMILEAAQTGITADRVIDQLAEEWNDLKSEYQ